MRFRIQTRATLAVAVLVLVVARGIVDAAASKEVSSAGNAPILRDDMVGQVSASIMGESALVDKETGRVLWEGGTSTLSASLAPILGSSIKHVRATLLTGIFLLALIGSIVARIRRSLFSESETAVSRAWPMTALLFVADWTVLNVPQVHTNLLIASITLYLLEAYTCSTRRYLANALSSPVEVEDYIERLRQEPPVVSWKVRCFHYERRKWLSILSYLSVIVKFLTLRREEQEQVDLGVEDAVQPSSFVFTRKIVTHQAISSYNYTSCEDKTTAGVWRRAEATETTPAPFSKIVLSKLLVLPNAKAREDYFKQQSTFVTKEGSDEYTEFSTSIQVKGFRRRMLAVRPVEGVPSAKLFRLHLFWMFTLIGLTVPYRIWFARHCDELRVTVAKETATGKTGSSSWSWFSKSASKQPSEWNKEFKSKMRELALYKTLVESTSNDETKSPDLPSPTEDKAVSDVPAIIGNETSIVPSVTETNATESKSESNDGKKDLARAAEPPPPPPPPATKEEETTEATTDQQDSVESLIDGKEE